MLVKLAFAMQRLKKYQKKNFVMINKDWGDIELMGGSPSPPTRENPVECDIHHHHLFTHQVLLQI